MSNSVDSRLGARVSRDISLGTENICVSLCDCIDTNCLGGKTHLSMLQSAKMGPSTLSYRELISVEGTSAAVFDTIVASQYESCFAGDDTINSHNARNLASAFSFRA
eukprot:gb/GECG01006803.1/.p1 GENE.gb/GECG01006803.1/~~gb/GECG01006803.1/.p1  ORF type:complete len:107 (+),score=7.97 gb/GECG01006803.1/:1-321(+)